MKTFQFPTGTTQISKEELAKAFMRYERVEIPGTVFKIESRFDNDASARFIIKELVLNEGTKSLNLFANRSFSVNVPKSLQEISTNAHLPRVLCLPQSFNKLNWGLNGVEYLQAYSDSEVRYCFRKSQLKHYVYLGKKISAKSYIFDYIPDGCVIHVEGEKMAEKVLKKGGFDVATVYVIPDALEWKDFPADKLALTMEEYNPESRVSKAQITLMEKIVEEQERKAAERTQEIRECNKWKMMGKMVLPLVEEFMSDKGLEYQVSKTVIEGALSIQFQLSEDLYVLAGIKPESPEESLGFIVDAVRRVRDLYTQYKEDIAALSIQLKESYGFDRDRPYVFIPIAKNVYVRGNMRMESLASDATKIAAFAQELKRIFDDAARRQIELAINSQGRILR